MYNLYPESATLLVQTNRPLTRPIPHGQEEEEKENKVENHRRGREDNAINQLQLLRLPESIFPAAHTQVQFRFNLILFLCSGQGVKWQERVRGRGKRL